MENIVIKFPHFLSSQEIKFFERENNIGNYHIKIEHLEEPPKGTGGFFWYGMAIIIASGIAGGFFNELGRDIYINFKKALFTRMKKFRSISEGKGMFTIDISINEGSAYARFDLTDLNESDFLNAIEKVSQELETTRIKNCKNEVLHFTYNTTSEVWEFDEFGG